MSLGPLIIDVAGHRLAPEEREQLLHPWVGGIILFTRNFEDREQLAALTREIRALRPELLVSVDHEGGRVQRFREGFTALPSFQALAQDIDGGESDLDDRLARLDRACERARALGHTVAKELQAVGVHFSYTPVLDVDFGRSAVMAGRSFHHDPAVVSLMAAAVMQGLHLGGMQNCGKHFPGHGWAQADSHEALPVDERPLEEILSCDARPYERLGRGPWGEVPLTAVMPAHIRYKQVDEMPAGFSRIWLQTILRERLGFDGVIISDDLSMAGAAVLDDVVDRANAALEAGCDAVLICNRPDMATRVIDELPARLPNFLNRASRRGLERLMPC
ncbi:MAG: beta-N-acetylhexosaminidase [Betaproteobacteria bacterium]|nr:beta-N-acetylhexosaminidase [Betaproteobacteria bacterium]